MQVINQDPTKFKGEFEDTSQVEKYEMSTEDYAKREGQQVLEIVNISIFWMRWAYVKFRYAKNTCTFPNLHLLDLIVMLHTC